MKVFVDTSAWLAFYDRSDQHHQAATHLAEQLKKQRANLVLSDFILTETLTIIRYRIGHQWAVRFGQSILDSQLAELVNIGEPTRRRAWDIFQQYKDKDFSFTDCTSFAMMEQLGLKVVVAFDKHFEQYGFPPLKS